MIPKIRSRMARRTRDVLGITAIQQLLDQLAEAITAAHVPDFNAISRIESLSTVANTGTHPLRPRGVDQAVQHLLRLSYRGLIETGRPLPPIGDSEMRFYSQSGEDGIIQLILAAVGSPTKRSVEICAGDGIQCNTANLIVNHGWDSLLVDGGEELVTTGRHFYEAGADTWISPPTLRREWVTAENVNDIVGGAGFGGAIDLLSIDVDGMDYWIWKALDCVQARVVVAECQGVWGPHEALSVPYDPDFVWEQGSYYAGATIAAMCKLAEAKGYRLVGTHRHGFNAFFVQSDLARDVLPTARPEDCLDNPHSRKSMQHLDEVRDRPWVRV